MRTSSLFGMLMLAAQRARQTWRMLVITGLGIVCAVMLVCAVPVYSKVAMTAGMRNAFSPYAQNGEIIVRSLPRLISAQVVEQAMQRLKDEFQRALVIQALGLGLIALALGPLLVLLIAYWLGQLTLAPADREALQVITLHPVETLLGAGQFALIAVAVTVLAMILALWGATKRDVLALRREAARSTFRPLWQRLNLDGIALVIALVSFGVAIYLGNASILTTRLRLLLLSPLTLFASVCLLLAGLLILLRFFVRLLRMSAKVASHSRGAAPLLALAQMARSPRQSMRTALLLTLASTLAIFALIFSATQAQQVRDVTDYRAGADFSGAIPIQRRILCRAEYASHSNHHPILAEHRAGYTGCQLSVCARDDDLCSLAPVHATGIAAE